MAQDETATRAAIDAANRKFEATFNGGDPAKAARDVYTAGARALPPDMSMMRGREALEQFWPAAATQMGVTRVRLSTIELELHGDVAHEIGQGTLALGGGQEVSVKYCVLWRQEQGEWRWDVDIWNNGV